jgi:hypothetical protein
MWKGGFRVLSSIIFFLSYYSSSMLSFTSVELLETSNAGAPVLLDQFRCEMATNATATSTGS